MVSNTRKRKSKRGLDKVFEDGQQSPMSALERRVIQLENDVAILKQMTRWPVFKNDEPTDKKAKPGVKEKIEDEVLFRYRDGLTLWLEAYWPWLESRLYGAGSAEEVGAILEAVSEDGWRRSLDRCSAKPSGAYLVRNTDLYYRELYGRLRR